MEIVEPTLHDNAIRVLNKQKITWPKIDDSGRFYETPGQMFARVASVIADAERVWGADDERVSAWAHKFRDAMSQKLFIPNSPCLQNAGKPKGQLSACFVLPIDDSIESIYDTLKHTAQIQASGGGTGFSGARLRCKGSAVGMWGKTSDGNIPFLELYNFSSKRVLIQGAGRKGANMWVIPCWHADVEDFIDLKKDVNSEVTQFNISVGATRAFMAAVAANKDWNLLDPKDGHVVKTVNAADLFERICNNAHAGGDPGLYFLDRVNEDNPTPEIGQYETCNPCGEQPLLPYEACVLGHLNLGEYVNTAKGDVNWDLLGSMAQLAVRFLDNVIEVSYYPIKQIEEMHKNGNRKIGVGVMGFADLLAKLQISYTSKEALMLADRLGQFIRYQCDVASVNLAQERGSFPNFEKSAIKHRFPHGKRNACTVTIAPTGTTGVIFGAATAIEPFFGLVITRNQAGMVMDEVHPPFAAWLSKKLSREHQEMTIEFIKNTGSIIGCPWLNEDEQRLWVQANDVPIATHIAMQATWQKHIDSAVSKTINMPRIASVQDVKDAYWQAYEQGCKGITIYRDGSKEGQAITVKKAQTAQFVPYNAQELSEFLRVQPEDVRNEALATLGIRPQEPDVQLCKTSRDRVTVGPARKIPTGCGNAFIFIGNGADGQIDDVVGKLGKGGGCAAAWWEALTRICSLAIRHGVEADEISKQLSGISCHLPAIYADSPLPRHGDRPHTITSCADALATAFREHKMESTEPATTLRATITEVISKAPLDVKDRNKHAGACPDCGSSYMEAGGGCVTCHTCGFSRC